MQAEADDAVIVRVEQAGGVFAQRQTEKASIYSFHRLAQLQAPPPAALSARCSAPAEPGLIVSACTASRSWSSCFHYLFAHTIPAVRAKNCGVAPGGARLGRPRPLVTTARGSCGRRWPRPAAGPRLCDREQVVVQVMAAVDQADVIAEPDNQLGSDPAAPPRPRRPGYGVRVSPEPGQLGLVRMPRQVPAGQLWLEWLYRITPARAAVRRSPCEPSSSASASGGNQPLPRQGERSQRHRAVDVGAVPADSGPTPKAPVTGGEVHIQRNGRARIRRNLGLTPHGLPGCWPRWPFGPFRTFRSIPRNVNKKPPGVVYPVRRLVDASGRWDIEA